MKNGNKKNKVFLAKAKQWLIESAFHSVTEFLDLDGQLYQFLYLQIIYFIIYLWKNYIYVLIWGVRACLVNNYFCSLFYVGCCTLVLKVYCQTFEILFSVYRLHIKLRNKLIEMTWVKFYFCNCFSCTIPRALEALLC